MGKSSGVVIAIIGLIIGAAGLGVGAYSYITFQAQIEALDDRLDDVEDGLEDRSVQKTWYDEVLVDWKPSATYTNETITDLSINIQVGENEAVYILFVTRVTSFVYSQYAAMSFRFTIDGVIINKPYTAAGSHDQKDNHQYTPVVLQYSTNTLSEDSHTISVAVESRQSSAYARHCTLLVQTYIP